MKFLITENHLEYIIENHKSDNLEKSIKDLHVFANKLYSDVKLKFGIDLKLLTTWGAAVGGLVAPLDEFIRTGNFNLNEGQVSLILVGIAATLFFDNEVFFKKIYKKIKSENIEEEFLSVLKKGQELKKSFIKFMISLNISINNVSALVRYSFLIPIIMDLQMLVYNEDDLVKITKLITTRILASGAVLVSSELLYQIIRRILRKFI